MLLSGVRRHFSFNLFLALVFCRCSGLVAPEENTAFRFTTIDVGQGLSQIAISGNSAVVWDLGSARQYNNWQKEYRRLGQPHITGIVISHSDEDHWGGLNHLGPDINWNGTMIVSAHEDTAFLRKEARNWSERIRFRLCVWDDTLQLLDSVFIKCLWPPERIDASVPVQGIFKNRYSVVFSVTHGLNRILITSDIDTVSQRFISGQYGYELRSQVLVVPHHGSAGSAGHVFLGYVQPAVAIISCSRNNSYGHPAPLMLQELMHLGAALFLTYVDGSIDLQSNGFYWSRVE